MSSEQPRRSTRNRKRKPPPPNPALYVGYTEDYETVEMIMKKFEVLHKIQKENEVKIEEKNEEIDKKRGVKSGKCELSDDDSDMDNNDNNNNNNNNIRVGLTEDQLNFMYKQTNYFTTKSAQTNNAIFYEKPIMDKDGFVMGYESNDYVSDFAEMVDYDGDEIYGNDNDDIYYYKGSDYESDDDDRHKGKRGGKSKSKKRGFRGHNGIDFGSALVARNNLNFNAVYHKKCSDKEVLEIPNYPIPISWMNCIKPLNNNIGNILYTYKECNVLNINKYINELNFDEKEDTFHGILMDPCFNTLDKKYFYNHNGLFTVDEFEKNITKDLMQKLCPKGMLFIYIESQLISDIITIVESWNFRFVEHAAWVFKRPNNKIALINKYGLCQSKKNLFLFRRDTKIELRHQRTSDTCADFMKYHPETNELINSDYQYKIIETLLPNSIKHVKSFMEGKTKLKDNDKQRLLYMWAPKNEKRDGWTVLCDPRAAKMDQTDLPHNDSKHGSNNNDDVDDDIDLKVDE